MGVHKVRSPACKRIARLIACQVFVRRCVQYRQLLSPSAGETDVGPLWVRSKLDLDLEADAVGVAHLEKSMMNRIPTP